MHILFLTDNFTPEVNAPASRTHEHAREWIDQGCEVTVITCAPNFPHGKIYDGYKNKIWQTEVIDGIRVIRVWSYISTNEGTFLRTADYLSFMLTSFIAAFFIKNVTVVVGTSPQFFTAISAWMISTLRRKPFVFELRDLWPESIRVVGALNNNKILRLIERLELFLYHRAAIVISVTKSFKQNLIQRGIDQEKIHVVTNGVDLERFSPSLKDSDILGQLGLKDKYIVGYIGTLGLSHALDTVLDAAKIIKEKYSGYNIHFVFLGAGAESARLKSRVAKLFLDNVTFLNSVPKDQVSRYWSILDVSVVHLRKNELFKTVIPSKIFESMGMGIPILHGVQGESAEIVEENKVGLLFEPENSDDLVKNIILLFETKKLSQSIKQIGPLVAEEYNRKFLARKMLNILKTLE